MFPSSTEQNHERISRAIDKLTIEMEKLEKDSAALFQDLKITPEQLNAFMKQKKSAVSDKDWQTLLEQYKIWDEKLEQALNTIRNPKTMKKKFTDLHQMHQLRNCLFVR